MGEKVNRFLPQKTEHLKKMQNTLVSSLELLWILNSIPS